MIKKNIYANELADTMQQFLQKKALNHNSADINQAVSYLNDAVDLFKSAQFSDYADKVKNIVAEISKNVAKLPTFSVLLEHGVKPSDLKEFEVNPLAKARINKALRELHYSDNEIQQFLGAENVMSASDVDELTDENRAFGKIWEWLQSPMTSDNKETMEFNIKSILNKDDASSDILKVDDMDVELTDFEDEVIE
jgi:hypothetical protein